jgi:hypothetical protein
MNNEIKVPNLTPWTTYLYAALVVALVAAGLMFMSGGAFGFTITL